MFFLLQQDEKKNINFVGRTDQTVKIATNSELRTIEQIQLTVQICFRRRSVSYSLSINVRVRFDSGI